MHVVLNKFSFCPKKKYILKQLRENIHTSPDLSILYILSEKAKRVNGI